jgi:hypothetical protein
MPKTYNTIPTTTTGSVYTAAAHNNIVTNVNNYRVPPMCVLTAGSQVISNTTATVLTYSSEAVDTDDMHSTSTNTSRITINTAGVYLFTCQMTLAGSGAAGSRVLASLSKAGTEAVTNGARVDTGNTSASSPVAVSLSLALSCAVNDYFEWQVFQSSGGNRTVDGSTFSAVWLGQVS